MKKTNTYLAFLLTFLLIGLPAMAQEAEEEAAPQEEGVEAEAEAVEQEVAPEEAVQEEGVEEAEEAVQEEEAEAIEEEAVEEEAVEEAVAEEAMVEEEAVEEMGEEAAKGTSFYVSAGGAQSVGQNLSGNWGMGPGFILGYNLPFELYLGPFTVGVSAEATIVSMPSSLDDGDPYNIFGIGASGQTMVGPVMVTAGAGLYPSSTGDLSNTTVGVTVGAAYPLPVQLAPNMTLAVGIRAAEILGSANDSGTTDIIGFGLNIGYSL